MADAFICKPRRLLANLVLEDWERAITIENYDLQYYKNDDITLVYNVIASPSLLQHAQKHSGNMLNCERYGINYKMVNN